MLRPGLRVISGTRAMWGAFLSLALLAACGVAAGTVAAGVAVAVAVAVQSRDPQHGPRAVWLDGANPGLAGNGLHPQLPALLFGQRGARSGQASGVSGADNPSGDALTVAA